MTWHDFFANLGPLTLNPKRIFAGHRRDALTAEDLAKKLSDSEVLELAGACGGANQTKFCWDPSTVA